jgi:hypothetical protein
MRQQMGRGTRARTPNSEPPSAWGSGDGQLDAIPLYSVAPKMPQASVVGTW